MSFATTGIRIALTRRASLRSTCVPPTRASQQSGRLRTLLYVAKAAAYQENIQYAAKCLMPLGVQDLNVAQTFYVKGWIQVMKASRMSVAQLQTRVATLWATPHLPISTNNHAAILRMEVIVARLVLGSCVARSPSLAAWGRRQSSIAAMKIRFVAFR
eukprot:gnl/TRDRNA2_/TRDRNA2_150878_c1_seq1.p2 gnl/TRDRNA2_/TRDRNA2_150878_c1~~gnl/TRDRNA2_/TRDRNA2_150878_c1_seq1.p2  ORF type:complete len:158 (+),score=10.32 gnl/TRDRNA2_/TRDRNA2_150878_c1_seq1:98-571(+)